MKQIWVAVVSILCLMSCSTPPQKSVYNARLYTVDNREIFVRDLKLLEKNYYIESQQFHPRWRESLEKINLDFELVASAIQSEDGTTRVVFRDGHEDEFAEFFIDKYNLKGWADYGPFEISSTLVYGLIFVDDQGRPVSGVPSEIPPLIFSPETQDRFVTFDGDIVSGQLLGEQFKILTAYGTLALDRDLISMIWINREGDDLMETIHLKNGDIISGSIDPPRFRMEIDVGQVVTIEAENLNRILFSRPVALEED